MSFWDRDWLVGANGLFYGRPGGGWTRLGAHEFLLTSIIREPHRLVVGAGIGSGLWALPAGSDRWIQLHDETLTEVLAIARIPGDPGVVAGSPYGIAVAERDDIGAARWRSLSDALRVNERFTNAVLVDPKDDTRWIVGTEAGVLVAEASGARWVRTSLTGMPARALLHAMDAFWAGTDDHGVWKSVDGLRWDRAGAGMENSTVYALAARHGRLIAGTRCGIAVGDGTGVWQRTGPRMITAAVAMHPSDPGLWMAGGSPGGLWWTNDGGEAWRQIGGFFNVRTILAPEEAAA